MTKDDSSYIVAQYSVQCSVSWELDLLAASAA
jgi:hypothetical protein